MTDEEKSKSVIESLIERQQWPIARHELKAYINADGEDKDWAKEQLSIVEGHIWW